MHKDRFWLPKVLRLAGVLIAVVTLVLLVLLPLRRVDEMRTTLENHMSVLEANQRSLARQKARATTLISRPKVRISAPGGWECVVRGPADSDVRASSITCQKYERSVVVRIRYTGQDAGSEP